MTLEKYRIFDQLIEGVQIIDPDWKYIYVNEAVAVQGKRKREELLGFTMMECYPGIEQSELYEFLRICMDQRKNKELINEFAFPDGSTGFFLLRMERINEGVLILSFDITEQKTAELIIRRTNEHLEELIRVRTSELLEQKVLIEKQIQYLKEANNAKDKFFSIVAHDLLSPLVALKALSSVLTLGLENLDTKEVTHLSKELVLSVDNTIKLANDLISWAKLQMKQVETNLRLVNVVEILNEIFELYKDSAIKKGIELNLSVDKDLKLYGDKNQISFIIRNLVNNALKYTYEKGFVNITVHPQPNNQILISVSDNGAGIPEKKLSKIFSAEDRRSEDGTLGEKGTGLGLLLSYEFIKLNNGKIEIKSELNKGTTVNVWLPNKKKVNTLTLN